MNHTRKLSRPTLRPPPALPPELLPAVLGPLQLRARRYAAVCTAWKAAVGELAHTAPRKQLVLPLGGCLEFRSCDVAEFDETTHAVIGAGDILLAEDLEGAGHAWRFVPARDGKLKPWRRCYIHLGEEYDHFVSLLKPQ